MSIATESHRESNWAQAVKEWNRRSLEDGWRSTFAPQMACPSCQRVGVTLSTINGKTTADCECGHRWTL